MCLDVTVQRSCNHYQLRIMYTRFLPRSINGHSDLSTSHHTVAAASVQDVCRMMTIESRSPQTTQSISIANISLHFLTLSIPIRNIYFIRPVSSPFEQCWISFSVSHSTPFALRMPLLSCMNFVPPSVWHAICILNARAFATEYSRLIELVRPLVSWTSRISW